MKSITFILNHGVPRYRLAKRIGERNRLMTVRYQGTIKGSKALLDSVETHSANFFWKEAHSCLNQMEALLEDRRPFLTQHQKWILEVRCSTARMTIKNEEYKEKNLKMARAQLDAQIDVMARNSQNYN